jgi:hypothetical protein
VQACPPLTGSSFRFVLAAGAGALAAALAGCLGLDAQVVHPAQFVGKWVRLRSDGTWGDTLEYLADGRVVGSVGHPVPLTDRWVVVRSKLAGEGFCAGAPTKPACQPFRLDGDTLLVLGRVADPTYFRRVQ